MHNKCVISHSWMCNGEESFIFLLSIFFFRSFWLLFLFFIHIFYELLRFLPHFFYLSIFIYSVSLSCFRNRWMESNKIWLDGTSVKMQGSGLHSKRSSSLTHDSICLWLVPLHPHMHVELYSLATMSWTYVIGTLPVLLFAQSSPYRGIG